METFFPGFAAAYCERYSCNHSLILLIENWKKAHDENFQICIVLREPSKAFNCIPHDLLIAKFYACDLNEETTTLSYLYLKGKG